MSAPTQTGRPHVAVGPSPEKLTVDDLNAGDISAGVNPPPSRSIGGVYEALGHDCVPIPLRSGTKRPAHANWQNTTLEESRSPEYQRELQAGEIGVLLGPAGGGIITVDLDTDEAATEFLAANPRLAATLRTRGRRGQNFWFRLHGPIPKSGPLYAEDKTIGEFRGAGTQTKILGIHPDTGLLYTWLVEGSPLEIAFDEFVWPTSWSGACIGGSPQHETSGGATVAFPTSAESVPFKPMPDGFGSATEDQVRMWLKSVPSHPDYNKWLRILAAVFSALPYDVAIKLLIEWSPEENAGEYAEKYRHRLTEVGIGTLVHYAKEGGWRGSDVVPPKPADDLRSRLAAREFDVLKPPVKPVPRFLINGSTVCTPGNLTNIISQAKTGKSAFIAAKIAAAICAELKVTGVDTLGVTAQAPGARYLLHVDTEQSPYDAHRLILRALKRVGVQTPPDFLKSYSLAGFSAGELRQSLRMTVKELGVIDGLFAVIIDGAADLVQDVNDATECNAFVAELHALAIHNDCPIICVVHENPAQDSGKMRGHLGSQLERKAESNLRLKRSGEITVVYGDKMRGAPVPEATGPRFQWDVMADMHMSTASKAKTRDDLKREKLRDLAEAVYQHLGKPAASYTDFLNGIQSVRKIGASAAEDRFNDAKRLRVIIKDPNTGRWNINPVTP